MSMPTPLTYPGVYIEELPSGVRTITGVATSITAFIGRALRGPSNEPVRVQNFAEFERQFGGLWIESTLGYAVAHFFSNGGGDALIVRVHSGATKAALTIDGFKFTGANEGKWGQGLRVRIEHPPGSPNTLFNLLIRDTGTGVTERFLNVTTVETDARYVKRVLKQQSKLVQLEDPTVPATRPTPNGTAPSGQDPLTVDASSTAFGTDDGGDGVAISDSNISLAALEATKQGLWALEKADLFNLLCIPPPTHQGDLSKQTRDEAAKYCKKRRALYVVDPLRGWADHTAAVGMDDTFMTRNENAALFFPLLRAFDPLREGQIGDFAPCGAVAGVFARTDVTRGVWKAPAGMEATLTGVAELTVKLTDGENGQLNPIAINCLRSFPVIGRVVWGSRTLQGADQLASQWKYIPVRRLALYIEESLFRGTQWVVFEPNDEPLWAQIRLNIGAFMQTLFRQGAFQGATPSDAYFVKCSSETTTQTDIDNGVVNIIVGYAPLKPAEFVVIKIQQIANQA
jgi:Bacteriophage tail sheath protein